MDRPYKLQATWHQVNLKLFLPLYECRQYIIGFHLLKATCIYNSLQWITFT